MCDGARSHAPSTLVAGVGGGDAPRSALCVWCPSAGTADPKPPPPVCRRHRTPRSLRPDCAPYWWIYGIGSAPRSRRSHGGGAWWVVQCRCSCAPGRGQVRLGTCCIRSPRREASPFAYRARCGGAARRLPPNADQPRGCSVWTRSCSPHPHHLLAGPAPAGSDCSRLDWDCTHRQHDPVDCHVDHPVAVLLGVAVAARHPNQHN